MNDKRNSLYENIMDILFVVFLLLLPFQNSGLVETPMNYMGAYLSNIPLFIMVLLSFTYMIYNGKIKFLGLYMIMMLYLCLLLYSLIICLCTDTDVLIGIYKIIVGCFVLMMQMFVFWISERKIYLINKYIGIVFFINVTGFILGDVIGLDMGRFIQHSLGDSRYHGLSSETSYFSFTTMILGILSIASTERKWMKFIYFFLSLTIVLTGGSKGTVACLPIAGLIYIISSNKMSLVMKMLSLSITIIFTFFIIQNILLDSIINDMENFTSLSTRFSSIIASVMILIDYPFGTGYGAFQSIFRNYFLDAFDVLNSYIPIISLSYNEIIGMVNDERGSGLTIKSIFFQYLAYYGFTFIIVLAFIAKKTKHYLNYVSIYWNISFLYVMIALLTYAQFFYDSIILLAVVIGEAKKNEKMEYTNRSV